DLNLKGLSVYSGRIGEKVASELITVVDDGRDPGQRGTSAMDDEGSPTQRTVLIEKGVLKTYLSDRKHAEKLKIERSGNARRESFRYLPICRMTNTMIERGDSDPDVGERRSLCEEDGRRSGGCRLRELRVRDHRVLPHHGRKALEAAARRDA